MPTPLCILLVDDSPFFLNLERQFLRNTPASLLEARSAGEALALARNHRPSLVFMNIDLPGADGLACCRQFRSDPELINIPIVLIGSRMCPELQQQAMAAGCDAFLAKPLDRRLFLAAGHQLLVSIDRREPRRHSDLPVSVTWRGSERHGLCIDISSGGLFLKIEPRAAKGEHLTLRLRLPDPERTVVSLTGRVAWVNMHKEAIKPDYPAGYGLEFVDISEEAGIALRRCFGS
ncbi:MAG: response regulator [Deltaproteobacteria bacterium]|nr:MAG: response regulator [Deltaproteobacteria bacterium]